MERLQKALGYEFRNPQLLELALTHSSYGNEHTHNPLANNERLEFLGDAVLGFVSADCIYRRYTALPEGRMTRLRAEHVCEQALFATAQKLGLGSYLKLGRGEEKTGGRERSSILSDTVEAIIAAIYLDAGLDAASNFIHRMVLSELPADVSTASHDYKSALQEELQKTPGTVFGYELCGESGPDHDKRFAMRLLINGEEAAVGEGHSKKEAEQDAARRALEALRP